MGSETLDNAVGRARGRLLPFLFLMYVLSFLDRANIGFAKQAFQASTGVSDAAYALGAGLFFLTYAALEVPSNLILHRIGARVWMARIMVSWGVISAAMCLVRGETSFYVLRLLLGAAEAGFFPGVILYLTYWFPDRARGQILGLFYFGAPVAFIAGGPLSGLLLDLGGTAGLAGWQWMFLVEGLLAVAVGVWAFGYLDDRPANAAWLPQAERTALSEAAEREAEARRRDDRVSFVKALGDGRVWLFVAIYFLIQMSVYGLTFFLPAEVAHLLGRKVGLVVGLVTALPWICAIAATFLLTRRADRTGAHRALSAAALAASAVGLALSAQSPPALALAALCLAAAGFIAAQPLFWTFPTRYLGGTAAAGGFATVNALGALGGFAAPNLKAWADARFGSPAAGLYLLAATTALGALLILALRHPPEPAAQPARSRRAF
ncbi:MAG TPA: MFS transporter [Phenylobacterium sp.]|nr:MFS transporter [Phenylobacterium sp.]